MCVWVAMCADERWCRPEDMMDCLEQESQAVVNHPTWPWELNSRSILLQEQYLTIEPPI